MYLNVQLECTTDRAPNMYIRDLPGRTAKCLSTSNRKMGAFRPLQRTQRGPDGPPCEFDWGPDGPSGHVHWGRVLAIGGPSTRKWAPSGNTGAYFASPAQSSRKQLICSKDSSLETKVGRNLSRKQSMKSLWPSTLTSKPLHIAF
jgi:hypothetical protein